MNQTHSKEHQLLLYIDFFIFFVILIFYFYIIKKQTYQRREKKCQNSTNLDFELSKNEVFIKNYSENEGMLEFLVQNNVVKIPKKCINSEYAMIPICELNIEEFVTM